jgi:PIN domain nuclease of toxin-antitoxin system
LRRLLLDTHALYWWLSDEGRLSPSAFEAIADSDAQVHVSPVNAYEISFKNRLGKLDVPNGLIDGFSDTMVAQGFHELAVTMRHALVAGRLEFDHRDPFDRLLIAQALDEGLTLVSNEKLFDAAGVSRLWD